MDMMSLPFHGMILLEKSEKLQEVDGTIHIALCAMAAEAFLEDLKSYYQAISKRRSYTPNPGIFNPNPEPRYYGGGAHINGHFEFIQESERNLESLIDTLERNHVSPVCKYMSVLKHLDENWNKGSDERFKNFVRLAKLRNQLVHMKSAEIELSDDFSVAQYPQVIKQLKRLGVVTEDKPMVSWIYMLDTEGVVAWARSAALEIMKGVLRLIPDEPISNGFRYSYESDLEKLKF